MPRAAVRVLLEVRDPLTFDQLVVTARLANGGHAGAQPQPAHESHLGGSSELVRHPQVCSALAAADRPSLIEVAVEDDRIRLQLAVCVG